MSAAPLESSDAMEGGVDLAPEGQESVPGFTINFTIPNGASLEDAQVFARRLLGEVEEWQRHYEPDVATVDLTKPEVLG